MNERRTLILMAILLALVGVFIVKPYFEIPPPEVASIYPPAEPLLPGENEIKSIEIAREEDGNLYATVHYYFRGGVREPTIRVVAESPDPMAVHMWAQGDRAPIQKGDNTVKIEIQRPYMPQEEFTSKKVVVSFYNGYDGTVGSTTKKEIDYNIAWISQMKYESDRALAKKSNEELYAEAVTLIDKSENEITLSNAKLNLERLLIRDPAFIPAYPELARIAMKTNWNAEGLKQAEDYLSLGLAQNPRHANSHVLLGYVYTHQNKLEAAQKEFETAAKIGTDNLWLWSNWGELYRMQDEQDKAIAMYLKALEGQRPFNTYDRARLDAYRKLLVMLDKKDNVAQAEPLYVKRADEFSDMPCLRSEYAAFMIYNHRDYEGALAQAHKAMTNGCNTDWSRQVMGIAYYVGWLKGKEEQRAAYLTQAKLLFPASPQLLFRLAVNEQTAEVLDALASLSINIDVRDSANLNALSYALMQNDVDAARRLIGHGAKLSEIVGEQEYPVAMTPIFYQHVEGVQLLLDEGINLSALTFRGQSAVDYAVKSQNSEIIRLVKTKIKT